MRQRKTLEELPRRRTIHLISSPHARAFLFLVNIPQFIARFRILLKILHLFVLKICIIRNFVLFCITVKEMIYEKFDT